MADVHVINALAGETGGDLLAVLLNLQDERQKLFYGRGIHIVPIRSLDQRLALEVQDRDQTRNHG